MKPTPQNIWSFAQNKPTLIVKDLSPYIHPDFVFEVLLKRGVFKWLAVRRDLIKLKDAWKNEIKQVHIEKANAKAARDFRRYNELKGYQKALERCRKDVRALCHSERWRAPDFDKHANWYLEKLEKK